MHNVFNGVIVNHVKLLESYGILPKNWAWYQDKINELEKVSDTLIADLNRLHNTLFEKPQIVSLLILLKKDLMQLQSMKGKIGIEWQEEQAIKVNRLIRNIELRLNRLIKEKKLLSFNRRQLEKVMKKYSIEALLDLFRPDFSHLFGMGTSVFEGYTLEQHIVFVLRQFDRYFSHRSLPGNVSITFFRTLLVIHDLGKPYAATQGDNQLQHEYTEEFVQWVFNQLKFSKDETRLGISLIQSDPIGRFLKYGNEKKAIESITHKAKKAKCSLEIFFELLIIFYKCDAGSYTADSGGIESLDYLFEFDHQNRELRFSTSEKEKISHLRKTLLDVHGKKTKSIVPTFEKIIFDPPIVTGEYKFCNLEDLIREFIKDLDDKSKLIFRQKIQEDKEFIPNIKKDKSTDINQLLRISSSITDSNILVIKPSKYFYRYMDLTYPEIKSFFTIHFGVIKSHLILEKEKEEKRLIREEDIDTIINNKIIQLYGSLSNKTIKRAQGAHTHTAESGLFISCSKNARFVEAADPHYDKFLILFKVKPSNMTTYFTDNYADKICYNLLEGYQTESEILYKGFIPFENILRIKVIKSNSTKYTIKEVQEYINKKFEELEKIKSEYPNPEQLRKEIKDKIKSTKPYNKFWIDEIIEMDDKDIKNLTKWGFKEEEINFLIFLKN